MFVEQSQFPWVAALAADWSAMRDECLAIPHDVFSPWVQRGMYTDGWSVYGFYAFGRRHDEALAKCPKTAAALARVPGLTTAGFSRLNAGAHILPHVGWVSSVYRLHLGLDIPGDCGIRVGTETRLWREGECLIFDDTTEHEAWNRSDRTRTILLLDFIRPGITDAAGEQPAQWIGDLVDAEFSRGTHDETNTR